MVTESSLSTQTTNFMITLLQILPNDTHSFNHKSSTFDAVSFNLRLIKNKAKVKPALQKPEQSSIIEMDTSNQFSNVTQAPYCLSTDGTARIKKRIPLSDTLYLFQT